MTAMEFMDQLTILCKRADDEIDVQYETHSLISRRIVRVREHVKARYLYNVRNRRERPIMSTFTGLINPATGNIHISDSSENEILIPTGGAMGDVRVSSDSDIRVTSVQGSFESDTATATQ